MNNQNDIFDERLLNLQKDRRKLLPWWMKAFIWIFLLFSAMIPIVLVFAFLGYNTTVSLYGIETNNALSTIGVLVITLYILKGVVSYGLWLGKKWAIDLGILDAIVGILSCFYVMYISSTMEFSFRLEVAFLIPYLIKLLNLKPLWSHGV